MYQTLAAKVPKDDDLPQRAWRMDVLNRILDGKLYQVLDRAFHEEFNDQGEYIPMRDRRPSVIYNLARIVVNDSVSLLFSEGHFPIIHCDDELTREVINRLIKDSLLNETMIHAAVRGSIGSVAIIVVVRKNRLFFEVKNTQFMTPIFDDQPDLVKSLVEQYKCSGFDLRDAGYTIDKSDLNSKFWFKREWTAKSELWYKPVKVDGNEPKFIVDAERTVDHKLGFCPVVWVRNLPGTGDIDGDCTFDAAITTSIEIDYQLSQGGRGLKYSSQPTTVIKTDTPGENKAMIAGDSLLVPTTGDAKMLEISGGAAQAVIEYVRFLRELALEQIGGNRTDGHKIAAAQSGRAMEMMNQGLVWLADKLRISYGEGALLRLLDMIRRASTCYPLVYRDGSKVGVLSTEKPLVLKWAPWYPPTAADRASDATALSTLKSSNLISTETAVTSLASTYDIEDVEEEVERLKAEAEADAKLAQKAETKPVKTTEENDQ